MILRGCRPGAGEARGSHFWAENGRPPSTCSQRPVGPKAVLDAVARDPACCKDVDTTTGNTPLHFTCADGAQLVEYRGFTTSLPRRRLRRRRRRRYCPSTARRPAARRPTSLRCYSKRTPARPAI